MSEIKVLFSTSEMAPLIKTGGLADVSGALPAALVALEVDIRVIVPGYPQVLAQMGPAEVVADFEIHGFPPCRLLFTVNTARVPVLVLDCPVLYQREGGPYQDSHGADWCDNAIRFGLLCKVTAMLASADTPLSWHPDLVHCNDWQTGLVPAYLHYSQHFPMPSVMTIHNLAFQGCFPPETLRQLQLPQSCFSVEGLELYGSMSFLKAGLYYANYITTVSPNYAREIQRDPLGFGLQGLLSARSDHLTGILNGIDIQEWNPETDPMLAKNYSSSRLAGKSVNKTAVQSKMGLTIDPDIPLLGVVSRFTHQKGLDLLLNLVPSLLELPVQLVMLGSGEHDMQQQAMQLAHRYPGKVGVMVGFDEVLSRLVEAGSDIFVMPSRFEPCGLNQFYSQCYGTPPIVHATGGLVDSVIDCNADSLKNGLASGFVFDDMTESALSAAIQRAVTLYHDKAKWKQLCRICMTKDFSWETSAKQYRALYYQLCSA